MSTDFDIHPYTDAPLRMEGVITFTGKRAEEVFAILGNPNLIPQWYLLAKSVRMHPVKPNTEQTFNVEFTFFGDVYEEVLHWDPPKRYVYRAHGDAFPIKDYVAEIAIEDTDERSGKMIWRVYCDRIEGAHYQKILPVMLPAINEASLKNLSQLIGGTRVDVSSYF